MALVVCDLGECDLLDKMIRDALDTDENYVLRLFKNDYTPSASTILGEFQECDFTNYSSKTLSRAGWNAATTVSNKAQTAYTTQSWTCGTTGGTAYGYYMVSGTSNIVLWAERFSSARVLANSDVLNLSPTFTLSSEN